MHFCLNSLASLGAMTSNLLFQDFDDIRDLGSFLTRAKKLDETGMVRLRTYGNILTVTVSPIFDSAIMGTGPKILGMRIAQLASPHELDSVFETSSILERIALLEGSQRLDLAVPPVVKKAAWGGVSAPQEGWVSIGDIESKVFQDSAELGIAKVAEALGKSIGVSISNKVRFEVWGSAIESTNGIPAGAAFALYGLGFLDKQPSVSVYRSGAWLRLSTRFGHVLAKVGTI
jgi:hypothetical protein